MTSTNPALDSTITRYAESVHREATRRAIAMRHGRDADDIAGDIALKFLQAAEFIMASFPDPHDYVRACIRNAGVAHDRAQRVQRCEGVRLVDNSDGTKSAGRRWVSGNATIGESDDELFGLVQDFDGAFEDRLIDRIDAHREFRRCVGDIPHDLVAEVMQVDGYQYGVNEVAARCGKRRETVSRRVNTTRQRMRQNHHAGRHAKDTPA